MKRFRHRILCLATSTISFLISTHTFAAAFQLYELGTPIIGTAGVGQAAVANDASTAYFNPAGMSQLHSTQFMVGSQVIIPNINFSIGPQNTILGGNGGNAGVLTPGLALYFVKNVSSKVNVGLSFTSPYGGQLNYTNGWAGRYIVQDSLFYALDLNASASYTVNRWLAVAAGLTEEYVNLNQTVALPILGFVDGQANIKVTNYSPGYNFGILLTPSSNTKIGIAYRSRIIHNLSGTTTFLIIPDVPTTKTTLIMPQNIIVSLDQAINRQFNLLGELGWSNWSSMHSSVVTISHYTATTLLNWKNTYRIGLGLQYLPKPNLTLQGGVSYDSSPTSSSLRTPNLPMDQQYRFAAGLIYASSQAVKLGFSYEFINFGRAPINNISTNGTLQGHYSRNNASVFQASVNVVC